MRLKSITLANGWYRVIGNSRQSYHLEEVAAFGILEVQGADLKIPDDVIVGIPAADFGVQGNEEDQYLNGVAGYVQVHQTEFDASGKHVLKQAELQKLVWED